MSRLLSRLAALGLFALLLGAAWLYVVSPVTAHVGEVDEQITHNRALIARLARSVGGRDGRDARIADLRARLTNSRDFVRAETEALAAAAMRAQIERKLTDSGIEIKSFQALPSAEVDGMTRITVRLVLRGEMDALMEAFYRLETEPPYLFVGDMRLTGGERQRRRNRNQPEQEPLSVVLQLSAYVPPGAPE